MPGDKGMEDQASFWPKNECLGVEVTTRCNSSCSHCFVRARRSCKSNLAPIVALNLVREGYEAGYRHLHITGGEPLLWEGLLGLLDHAFALGYETAFLNTNGTLLTREVSRRLAAYRSLAVSVSLQGPRRLHDRVRGKGSYDLALRGIRRAMNAGLPVHIFTTVGRSLLPDLPPFADDLSVTLPDVKQLTLIQIIRVKDDAFDLSKEVLTPDDFLTLVRMVSLLNLYGLNLDVLNNPLATVASRALGMPWVPPSPPLVRMGSILVTAELRMTLAHSAMEDFGTYEPGMLPRITSSGEYLRAVSADGMVCGRCVYSPFCRRGEMLRPSEWYRDMFPQVPYCKRVLSTALSDEQLHHTWNSRVKAEPGDFLSKGQLFMTAPDQPTLSQRG